jgi:intein-encoded DNA endonuclease-like protein
MVADLKQYGIVQNKTYLGFSFPEMIPTNFYKDFIRGYFDGDGSIYFTSNKYVLSWVGNEEFLTILKKILNKPQISLCQNCKSKITYDLKISGKKYVLRILHYMYDNSNDSIRLTRKYKIVQKVFSLESANTFELVNARCE